MSLKTLRDDFHAQSLLYRNIDNILHNDDFAIAYAAANLREKCDIISLIYKGDKKNLKKFIGKQLENSTPFYKMGIRKLREIGRNVKIKNSHILHKATLIEEIENVAARLKKDS